jgi:hypothetical protein
MKFSFKFSQKDLSWEVATELMIEKYDFLEINDEGIKKNIHIRESVEEQVSAEQEAKPLKERWYNDIRAMSEYSM